MTTAGILLAAGASRRFGEEDKLMASLNGAPLVSYAARALQGLDPDILIGVTRSAGVAACLEGFECVSPPEDNPLQSDSLRVGITKAQEHGATRALIVLGDMPYVAAGLLADVVALCTKTMPSATSDGQRIMPPACFPKASFLNLCELAGDRGAASLLQDLPLTSLVAVSSGLLLDIDTPGQLSDQEPPEASEVK
ncbi:MAG: NTP transferase domain-containing protein [Pseudomonadota bacterium]